MCLVYNSSPERNWLREPYNTSRICLKNFLINLTWNRAEKDKTSFIWTITESCWPKDLWKRKMERFQGSAFYGFSSLSSQLQAFSSVPSRLINLSLIWLDPSVSVNDGHWDDFRWINPDLICHDLKQFSIQVFSVEWNNILLRLFKKKKYLQQSKI